MAQAGIIKTITGIVNARTPDGQVRQLMAGDMVYENEIIETSAGSEITIELSSGKSLALAENSQVVLDETVITVVDEQDAVVTRAQELQAALEAGEDDTEEDEPAAGEEDEEHDFDLAYYAGDQSRGEVGSYLFPTQYGGLNEDFPDVEGEEENLNPSLSAIGVVVDETDGLNNVVTGSITVDYATAGGTLSLAADGAVWDAGASTLIYQQGGIDIWQIILDQNTGTFIFEQLAAFDHGLDENEHNTLAEFGVTVTATNTLGNTATTTFTAGIYDDGPRITGSEILSAELGTAADDIASPEATSPADVIGMVTGDADGELGTDGPGGFFLWDASAAPGEEMTSHILVESTPGNPVYEIFMDSETGEWTFYQYQPIADDALDFDFRAYDGDTDWTESGIEVPLSQFVVGSDPEGLQDETSSNIQFGDDITGSTDPHAVPSLTGESAGEILGQGAADVLVGDPGSVIPEPFSSNYIMVLDYSHSVTDTTSLLDIIDATKETIRTLYGRVERGVDGSEVTINLLPFAEEANALNHSAWISFRNENGAVVIENSLNPGDTDTIDEIMIWIDGSTTSAWLGDTGLTNYNAAFTQAQHFVQPTPPFGDNPNHVIFISDGSPNTGGAYIGARDALLNPPGDVVDSIRAVGITLNARTEPIMDAIDYPAGDAVNFVSGQLADVIIDLIPQDVWLNSVGNDEIYGNDGNDLIFGDALNTDGVFEDLENEEYDLSSIKDLPDGSGWEVFAELEAANPGLWTREDTIRYIQENHETLAQETIGQHGEVRYGGYDDIEGGAGDDIIYGQEGNDTIDAGAGDDVVDGGSGFDTLMVTNETELDFSNVSNIERIELDEGGIPQTITLTAQEVLDMSSGDALEISGGSHDGPDVDTIQLDATWTQAAAGSNVFNSGTASITVFNATVDLDGTDIQIDDGGIVI